MRALLPFLAVCAVGQNPLTPFPMPWNDASPGITNLSHWQTPIASDDTWVSVNGDAHYERAGQRLRFLGVNITAAQAFPSRTNADAHAARLARFGFNGVRFHHLEAPWDKQNVLVDYNAGSSRGIATARLDRLHYFVSALARNGIHSNINLLVSREFQTSDGLGPEIAQMDWKDQHILGFFNADALALHKEYAQKLLTAPNPHRDGKSLAEDPAVAFVEIMNENGLLQKWYEGVLDTMPMRYRGQLESRWNQWLQARYESSSAMLAKWGAMDVPLGTSLLRNGDFAAGSGGGWNIERHETAVATVSTPSDFDNGAKPALKVEVTTAGNANWHVQINQSGILLEAGKVYTASFWARATTAGVPLGAQVGRAYGDYGTISSGPGVSLTTAWREYTWVFQASGDETNARINFNGFGNLRGATVLLADIRVQPGGKIGGVPDGRSLESGNVPNVARTSAALAPTAEQRRDWIRFIFATEKEYFIGMQRYIKEDLGYRGIVFGTIISNSPPNVQAALDAVDSHAYWQHPSFLPGRDFDPVEWTVANTSMLADANAGTLGLARQRVKGRPHNVTEYQHSSPNTYSSESPILSAAYGAFQDWDSIWFFEYGTSTQEYVSGFFDQGAHVGKMVNNLIAAAMFRRGDVAMGPSEVAIPFPPETEVALAATRGGAWNIADGSSMIAATYALTHRIALVTGESAADTTAVIPPPRGGAAEGDELLWAARVFTAKTPKSKVLAGFAQEGVEYDLADGVSFKLGSTRQKWATAALTLLEGESFAQGGRALAVLTGDQENTGQVWKDPATRVSVGNRWGSAPVLIESVPATLTLQVKADRVKAWKLDERGQRGEELQVTSAEGKSTIALGGSTVWYEIEIAPVSAGN